MTMTTVTSLLWLALLASTFVRTRAFVPIQAIKTRKWTAIQSSTTAEPSTIITDERLDQLKADLVRCCTRSPKPSVQEVRSLVEKLEAAGEQVSTNRISKSNWFRQDAVV
jgi:hypothetical protein